MILIVGQTVGPIGSYWALSYFASSPPGRFATTLDESLPGRFATWTFTTFGRFDARIFLGVSLPGKGQIPLHELPRDVVREAAAVPTTAVPTTAPDPHLRAKSAPDSTQSHRLERVVPTYALAGVRSRGFVAAMFCPSGCGAATGAVVHSHSLTQ